MKFKELKALPVADLQNKLVELRKELIKENAQVAIGTMPKNPRKLRLAKKTIARIQMLVAQSSKKPSQSIVKENKPMEVSAKK